ncbi:MAG: hypothetical protein ACO1QB_13810 [Verrucomicrobiales bacterium]
MKTFSILLLVVCFLGFPVRAERAGSVDASFNPGSGAGSFIETLVVLPDSRALVGGSFTSWNGLSVRPIVRLDMDGSLDQSFDPPVGILSVGEIALRLDGKYLVAGFFRMLGDVPRTNLAQLLPDGSLDLSFEANCNNFVHDIYEYPDGRLLITGAFSAVNGIPRGGIALLKPNGGVDDSFVPEEGLTGSGESIHVFGDGSILVAGLSWNDGLHSIQGMVRFDPSGVVDKTFDLGSPSFFAEQIFPLADEHFILQSTFYPSRVLANDALDQHFVNGTASPFAKILAKQADDRLLFAGNSLKDETGAPSTFLRTFNDGKIDPYFRSEIDGQPDLAVARPDGKILVAGHIGRKGEPRKFTILLMHGNDESAPASVQWSASNLDALHNSKATLKVVRDGDASGAVTVDWWALSYNPLAVQVTPNYGQVSFAPGETHKEVLVELASDRRSSASIQFDLQSVQGATYGTNKMLTLWTTNEISMVELANQTPSIIEVGGRVTVSLRRDGAVNRPAAIGWRLTDPESETSRLSDRSGVALFPAGRDFAFFSIGVLDDDQMNGDATNAFELFNIEENAQLTGVINGWILIHDNDLPGYAGRGADNQVNGSIPFADGGLLIVGNFNTVDGAPSPGFARLKADGSVDAGFQWPSIGGSITDFAALPDGKILVVGNLKLPDKEESVQMARLLPNGQIDETFGPDKLPSTPQRIAIAKDGILVTGSSSSFNGMRGLTNLGVVARLDLSGRKDSAFATPTALASNPPIGFIIPQVKAREDGKFYLYGPINAAQTPFKVTPPQPTIYNSGIVRFLPDGELDTSFHAQITNKSSLPGPISPAGADLVRLLEVYPDGKIWISGSFNNVKGVSTPGIARLLENGDLDLPFHTNLIKSLGASPVSVVDVKTLPNGETLVMISRSPAPSRPPYGLVRLNPDGSLDKVMNLGTTSLVIGTVETFVDGSAFVGSTFTVFEGEPRYRMAWLEPDGSLRPEPIAQLELRRAGDGLELWIYSMVNGNFDIQKSLDLRTWENHNSVNLQRGTNKFVTPAMEDARFFKLFKR